ncbi:hypothetical protein KR054_011023, partial [Drosophila jambulina]
FDKMSKSARGSRPKMPFASTPSASSISGGGEPNQGLEAMLHVTQVQTSCPDEAEFYYRKGDGEKSLEEMSLEVKAPDLEEEVPLEPPFVAMVSNLPMECFEKELSQVFSNFSIRTLTVPKKGKRPKGFAYVEMSSREELIRLLQMEKLKCRGRLLSIKLCPDPEKVPKHAGAGGDAPFTPLSISDFDDSSSHYAASVSDLTASEAPSSPEGSPRLGSELPISRKPSSIDELERRMDLRLQKLAEFENAQTDREKSSQMDDDHEDVFNMSWTDVLSEIRKSE